MRWAPLACLALWACDEPSPARVAPASSAPASSSAPAPSASASSKLPEFADPSRLSLSGETVQQGSLLVAKVEPGTTQVAFPGHDVRVSEEGQFLIGFYRNAPPREKMTIVFPDGARLEKIFEVKQRAYGEDRIDGLPERFVRLSPERKAKLGAANARIAKARKNYSEKPFYEDGFAWPLVGTITSRYGMKRILNGTDGGLHWGIDIAAPVGAEVKAPSSGVVTFVEEDVPLAGHTLVIDHGHGLSSTLIHLKDFLVKVGDEVTKGDPVATVGMTGRTNGPHLDWRMNLFETYRLDPELLVPPMP